MSKVEIGTPALLEICGKEDKEYGYVCSLQKDHPGIYHEAYVDNDIHDESKLTYIWKRKKKNNLANDCCLECDNCSKNLGSPTLCDDCIKRRDICFKEHSNKIKKDSNIDHPAYYNQGKIEVIDIIVDWKLNFTEGCIIKYLLRYKFKDKLKDLKKIQWYINRLINDYGKELEEKQSKD